MSDIDGTEAIRKNGADAKEVNSELQSAREKLVELDPKIRGDLREIYSEEYLQAASILFREDPVEFRGLQNRLKGRGVHKGDFERMVREFCRKEQGSSATATAALGATPKYESQATALVKLAESKAEFFHHGEDCFATISVSGHLETHSLKSRAFKRWLSFEYLQANSTVPNAEAISAATNTLSGCSVFKGSERRVFLRVGRHEDRLFLDLCDARWRVVEIDRAGWRVIDSRDCPIRFRRAQGMRALPAPERGGSASALRDFVNVANDQEFKLVLGWLVAAMRDAGPYPILTLNGEPGTAKSTTARVLHELLDPNAASLRSAPRDVQDLMIAATNGWLVAFDNLSRIPGWLSDALCRLATGGGFSTRELYSNGEEVIFDVQRPALLNGIEELMIRGDLLERGIVINPPRIDDVRRRAEQDFYQEFYAARPRIIGALLEAVSCALRNIETIKLQNLPRMADFVVWVEASASAFGWKSGEFLSVYTANRDDSSSLALETPVAQAMQKFVAVLPKVVGGPCWSGEAATLLRELGEHCETDLYRKGGQATVRSNSRPQGWPNSPLALSNALRRLAPNLRRIGIDIQFGLRTGHDRKRIIQIAYSENAGEPSSASSAGNAHPQLAQLFRDPNADAALAKQPQ